MKRGVRGESEDGNKIRENVREERANERRDGDVRGIERLKCMRR